MGQDCFCPCVENEPGDPLSEGLLPPVLRLLLFARVAFDAIERRSVEAILLSNSPLQIASNQRGKPTCGLPTDEGVLDETRVLLA